MSGAQKIFFTVPGVGIHGIGDVIPSGRVILSFDFEGRLDRFRASACELAGKGFASFVRVGTQGNAELSSHFGPKAARAVVNYVIQHPGAFAGTSSKLLEIYLVGTSAAAGAVAAIADEFEQVSKVLLIAPELKTAPQATEGISEFVGDVAILGSGYDQTGLDSGLKLETAADVARSCRSTVVPAIDERAISLAPFWAFFSDQPSIPASWPSLTSAKTDTIAPPTDRVRIAQLREKLSQYESPTTPVVNLEKKIWAVCQLLRGEPVTHRDLSMTFYRDTPKDIEDTLSVLAIQCHGNSIELDEADRLSHPLEIGYWTNLSQGPKGHVLTISLARRIEPGLFETIEEVPSVASDYGANNAATTLLVHYQGGGGVTKTLPDAAVSSVANKLAQGGRWFLPITYLEDLLVGTEAKGPDLVAETDPLTA